MRWPWHTSHEDGPVDTRADEAVAKSIEQERQISAQGQETRRIGTSLKSIREQNHLKEAFRDALGGH